MPSTFSRLTLALLTASLLTASLALQAANGVPPAGSARSQQAERWTINLKDADIREFIDQVAAITGETFIIDPRVKGQISVTSSAQLSLREVYQPYLSVMTTHIYSVLTQHRQSRAPPNA